MSVAVSIDELSDEELDTVAVEFAGTAPEEVLAWALDTFSPDIAMATGFGLEGCALVSMIAGLQRPVRIFYLDTDLLFPETYALRDALESRYGVRFERRATNLSLTEQALRYGDKLWERNPDECCRLRKIEPLRQMLSGLRAWITGIRRQQTSTRAAARVIERDPQFDLVKINPLVSWTKQDIWRYVRDHEVPFNPLLNQGYESIGCVPCTTPISIGEDSRAGRWRGQNKVECGIHLQGNGR